MVVLYNYVMVMPASKIENIREVSRRMVRALGFLRGTIADTVLSPSATHALIEIGARPSITGAELSDILSLEKSSVSRMLQKLVAMGAIKEQVRDSDHRARPLSLTKSGRQLLRKINSFAQRQVEEALKRVPDDRHAFIIEGLRIYTDALEQKGFAPLSSKPEIKSGYQVGAVARGVDMHMAYYSRTVGFGRLFEAQIASGMADFMNRLDNRANQIWTAVADGRIVGTIAVDGEDLGKDADGNSVGHLRWFIVDGQMRGKGVGQRLFSEAMAFCEKQAFSEIHLWTFEGLKAARHLYETNGFRLVKEKPGSGWGKEVIEQHFIKSLSRERKRQKRA